MRKIKVSRFLCPNVLAKRRAAFRRVRVERRVRFLSKHEVGERCEVEDKPVARKATEFIGLEGEIFSFSQFANDLAVTVKNVLPVPDGRTATFLAAMKIRKLTSA